MKSSFAVGAVVSVVLAAPALAEEGSPVGKVIRMISDLQAKVIAEGETSQKEYDEYSEWCEEGAKNLNNEIKTAKAQVEELQATIEEQTARTAELNTKVEDLTASISSDESELKAATEIRKKEAADFSAEEKELVETIDSIERATGILEKELAKGGASMLQVKNTADVVQALSALVKAEAINSLDASRLTALVQSSQDSEDGDDELEAPEANAYEGKSGGIIDTLGDLQEKAEAQLADARKKEQAAVQSYEMLAQSLKDQIKFATKDTDAAKKGLAEAGEKKSVAGGDLEVTSKDLAEDGKARGELHSACMTKARDFETATKSREEEVGALAKAKAIIVEATSGSASFLQVSTRSQSSAAGAAVRFVRDLARKHKAPVLAQLASRMAATARLGGSEGAVFDKVKGLITDMITKLEDEAAAGAKQKEYCDKEEGETKAKKEELSNIVGKSSTKIEQGVARSAKVKEQAADIQKQLGTLVVSQAEMDQMRQAEKAAFTTNEAETKKGLDGIKLALKVLREYYASADEGASNGAAGGIVSLLEVCESDLSKSLAEMRAGEEAAVSTYDAETQETKLEKAAKDKDVEHKTKEAASLDKMVSETNGDKDGSQAELDAVLEYLTKIEQKCGAQTDSYADRKAAREAEVAGLKEAMTILDGEAFVQKGSHTSRVHRHVTA